MHMKHALIVSDDTHTRAWVTQALDGLDLHTTECSLGEMQKLLLGTGADLVVLDGGRNPEAPAQVVEHAAAGGIDLCLLVLVEAEGLQGLRLPVRIPSDFMVRGGSSDELVARTRAVLWPGEEVTQQELVRIDNLTLNLATYQAYVDGTPVDFTYLEYALFSFLVTHPGRTYSREVLLRRVWGSDYYGGSRTVDVHVRRIRAKVGHELSRRLETVRNVGYLWSS
ncbi:MAG: transcriptional regulator [Actinobacteria bacterium HGW-Actinobacteria-7]|jgi:DNA-binding response OmpR family regulator|nr:MAG: transcriptional regulator [Actinobacteria bacterium HGW-Actinobacteria-7]